MGRLDELIELRDAINAEIESLKAEEILDDTLGEMADDLLDELEENVDCPCCVVRKYMKWVYEMAYDDAVSELL